MTRIGLLLPRSIDYPSIGFDLLDGLRLCLRREGVQEMKILTENTGLGDDHATTYACAEKLIMEGEVQLMIVYANMQNAQMLFPLAASADIPFIFLDPGMQFASEQPGSNCVHISLQGLSASHVMGKKAGTGGRRIMMASSFFDAGFRSSMSALQGLQQEGGTVSSNFVTGHKISEFTIAPYLEQLRKETPQAVNACFSIYLADLFWAALHEHGKEAYPFPMYCSPFMTEEQLLVKNRFPDGGEFYTCAPWATTLDNEANTEFVSHIKKEKNKTANIFHLLGWEAGMVASRILNGHDGNLAEITYDSPRGFIRFHPETNISYGPLYEGRVVPDNNNNCQLAIDKQKELSADEHVLVYKQETGEYTSGWRNNYFCA